METISKVVTPVKDPKLNRSKSSILSKTSENDNPNGAASPGLKSLNSSPLAKSGSKLKKSASKNANPNGNSPLLNNRIRERKFVVAKKSKRQLEKVNLGCKCSKGNGKPIKCLCVAYESLRASQEEFFKNPGGFSSGSDLDQVSEFNFAQGGVDQNLEIRKGCGNEIGEEGIKRSTDKLLVETKECVPEPGSGRVKELVSAFEKMKVEAIPISNESDGKDGENPPKAPERQLSSSSFCPSELFLTSECLGLDSRRSSSLDSSRGRNSSESLGAFARRKWRRQKQLKTTAKPFKLRTEERGKCKEEEFMKKVQQQMEEEEKLRVPIAQGLPWTTDEPECLVKPPLKEATRPIDLVLHSDVRAEERAEFDHQVSEKMSFIEQYRMERDRQQKLAEEEEIRRLRKELVPKAQPMPYFDRPFIPRRSEKQPTVPKEPKFHFPQHKKSKCVQQSWSDTSSYISSSDACYGL